jgi:hypothetical protein
MACVDVICNWCPYSKLWFGRFNGGVTRSFTGSAEDCKKLLSFNNLYRGDSFRFLLPLILLDFFFYFVAESLNIVAWDELLCWID